MVRYWDARYQLKKTIQIPDKSGIGMVTVLSWLLNKDGELGKKLVPASETDIHYQVAE